MDGLRREAASIVDSFVGRLFAPNSARVESIMLRGTSGRGTRGMCLSDAPMYVLLASNLDRDHRGAGAAASQTARRASALMDRQHARKGSHNRAGSASLLVMSFPPPADPPPSA